MVIYLTQEFVNTGTLLCKREMYNKYWWSRINMQNFVFGLFLFWVLDILSSPKAIYIKCHTSSSTSYMLPATLQFCRWPHKQTGHSSRNGNMHLKQYVLLGQRTVQYSALKRKWNGSFIHVPWSKITKLHYHELSPWYQPVSQHKVTIM
jgi:hypothetical protein